MRINVAQQLKGSIGDIRRYTVEETTEDGLFVQGITKFVRTNRSILVTGQFKTVIVSTCSRCLEEFQYQLEFDMEEEFFPVGTMPNGITVEMEKVQETDNFTIGEDHILDLSEALRQNILLNFPLKPVCKPECAGLCPKCGNNLNYGKCVCSTEQFDSRLSPLRQLFSDQMVKSGREVN